MSDSQENVNKRQHEGDGAEQQVKRARYQHDYNNFVVVLVGKEEREFKVHEDTICEKSKFFEAAISSDRWTEGQEKVVRLPEITYNAFHAYTHWVYKERLSPEVFWQDHSLTTRKEQQAYFETYLLADYLDDSHLRAHILDAIISKSVDWQQLPLPDVCTVIWDRTPKGSPLRTFVLEWLTSCLHYTDFTDAGEELPKEFLGEMVVHLMRHGNIYGMEDAQEFADRIREKLLP